MSDGQVQKSGSSREEEQVDEAAVDTAETDELLDEVDDLLDEIDDVLEENAEEFVKGYVQKGGE